MKLPSLLEVGFEGTAVSRKHLYRIFLLVQFPQLKVIDGSEVSTEDRMRAETYHMEQCMLRDDFHSMNLNRKQTPSTPMPSSSNLLSKLPIRVTSVVLDGLEMKLASNSSGFGSRNNN